MKIPVLDVVYIEEVPKKRTQWQIELDNQLYAPVKEKSWANSVEIPEPITDIPFTFT